MKSWQIFIFSFYIIFFYVSFSGTVDLQQSFSVPNYNAGRAGIVTLTDRKTVAALQLFLRTLLNYVNYF
jgi:hypothetical protein